jgi:16S rRNA G966 N2-methylase RsmD
MALEACSRGAHVTVLEKNREAAEQIRRAAHALAVSDRVFVWCGDAFRWRGATVPVFDGVLLDPPYADDLARWVERFLPLARSWLVLEHSARRGAPPDPRSGSLPRTRRYGDTSLSFYALSSGEE